MQTMDTSKKQLLNPDQMIKGLFRLIEKKGFSTYFSESWPDLFNGYVSSGSSITLLFLINITSND